MNNNLLLLATASFLLFAPAAQIMGMETSTTTVVHQDKMVNMMSNEELNHHVKQAILADKDLAKFINMIVINSDKGVVTLSGTVPNADVKANIEAKAKAVEGVAKVVNHLEIKV